LHVLDAEGYDALEAELEGVFDDRVWGRS